MIILAIETSCDETSVAVLRNKTVLSNVTISQAVDHAVFGGVVPGIAAKLHLKNIKSVFLKAIKESGLKSLKAVDYVAYTSNPGLVICLQIGKVIAETISFFLKKPLIPCNHLLGHAYSSLIDSDKKWKFPAVSLVVSGGHTQICEVFDYFKFNVIGETLDDAVGECLDKISISMGYSYPGGPIIEKLASKGKDSYKIPIPKNDDSLDFSFSGLKSYAKRELEKDNLINVNDFSYSLQKVISDIISKKVVSALKITNSSTLLLGGGVIVNDFFRNQILCSVKNFSENIEVFVPEKKYCNDNAAMIGILAYYKILKKKNFNIS